MTDNTKDEREADHFADADKMVSGHPVALRGGLSGAASEGISQSASDAGAGMPAWQPIETAPKDGRTILLGRFNAAGKWRTMRGQWMSADYIAEYWEDPDAGEPGWHETVVESDDTPNCWYTEPSHWMPLPAPPTSDAASQGSDERASVEAEFELHCDGEYAAGASGPREQAWASIQHYAAQYAEDGPCEIYEVRRTLVLSERASDAGGSGT